MTGRSFWNAEAMMEPAAAFRPARSPFWRTPLWRATWVALLSGSLALAVGAGEAAAKSGKRNRAATAAGVGAVAAAGAAGAAGTAAGATQDSRRGGGASDRIVAVVNEEAITASDLSARTKLILLSAHVADTAETQQRLRQQVLRSLIDERLQLQEAARLNQTITEKEIEAGIAQVAQQNQMSRAELERMLASRGAPVSTLKAQVKSTLAWTKVIQRKIRPTIHVGDEEVDAYLERFKANLGKTESLVAEIFLPVDTSRQEEEARRSAERLIEQMRSGASFSAMARQFSQGAGAGNGGDMGWIQPGQLGDELNAALSALRPGQLSPPVRTPSGYHILLVRDQRIVGQPHTPPAPPSPPRPPKVDLSKGKVTLMQLVTEGGTAKSLKNKYQELRQTLRGCEAMKSYIGKHGAAGSGDLGSLRLTEVAPQVAQLLAVIPVGEVTPPLGNAEEARFLMVCDRSGVVVQEPEQAAPPPPPRPLGPPKLPPREEVQQILGSERLDMMARRYMRDLRRAAFIDTRS